MKTSIESAVSDGTTLAGGTGRGEAIFYERSAHEAVVPLASPRANGAVVG
jgi:hypothetical protein